MTESLFADALNAIEARAGGSDTTAVAGLTQQHELIRDADEYGDLFAQAAATSVCAMVAATNTQGGRA